MRSGRSAGAWFTVLASVAVMRTDAAGGYHLLQKVSVVPGDGLSDYVSVDSVNRRVYCSHGDETVVLDADTGSVIGRIPTPPSDPANGRDEPGRTTPFMGVHHVAIASELGRGFTANGRAGTSTIFDLKTLARIGEVKVTGKDPNAIVYDALTQHVFTFNEASNNATVFDARGGTIVATLELGGRPAFATSDDKGHLFVNLIDKQAVLPIDSRNLSTGGPWPVSACDGPYNETMAIDKIHERLFVGCRPDYRRMLAPPGPRPNRVMAVLDATSGRVIATLPIGGNPDQADFDPGTGLAFSANGEGTVTVIKEESPDRFRVLETVQTEPGALRIAVDRKTHKIFVPNADPGIVPPATPENPNPPPGPPRNFRILILGT
jgi:DNA-binding beta-propeller fold protein YncE